MIHQFAKTPKYVLSSALFISTLFGISSSANAQSPDKDALALLKSSLDYVASLQQFTVQSESTIEVVLINGQKIQFNNNASMALLRPNKLIAKRVGDIIDQHMYYNGNTFTLFNADSNVYATAKVPATLDGMLDTIRDQYDIIAPASDLMYKNAYERMTQSATSGFIVGQSMINGVLCNHIAFRSPGTDWQLWIEAGAKPLPRKFVVTSTDVEGSPQFEVQLKNWKLSPNLKATDFEFTAPTGTQKINFIAPSALAK
ncbi:MAG TPA: DUF2092 domain-containing protein [Arenimonas sp.]|nr:DUF2092 domain-containing protein [Arenimonas sp.]